MQTRVFRLSLFLSLLAFAVLLRAQEVAVVTGTVTDATSAALAGATVTLENTLTGARFSTTTNAEGSYTINQIKPGPGYRILFSAPGFKPFAVSGIYMNVDSTRTQDARLAVGSATQTVEVSASNQDETLDTTDATVGNNVQVQYLNELPIEYRDTPSALFTQQPGVTLDGAVTGARVDQDNVTLDGLDVNDNETGCFGCLVGNAPVDSVQEFRGVTAGELASAGEGGGGQFELITRSGTNHFHGSLVEYHRDTDLEANDWFNNNSGVPRPPLVRNQYGGDIGGPIKRDKLFFFFDWYARRDSVASPQDRTVPIGTEQNPGFRQGLVSYINTDGNTETLTSSQIAALDPQGVGFNQSILQLIQSRFPQANDLTGDVGDLINTAGFRFNAPFPYTENVYVQRVDYSLNSKMKIWGRGTFTRLNQTWTAVQFPTDPVTYPHTDQSYSYVAGHTWTIGGNKVNQAEYGTTFESLNWPTTYNPTGDTQFQTFGGNGVGGTILTAPYASAINAQGRTYNVPLVKDDFSWLKGKHSITFGGTFKWITPDGYDILDYNTPALGLGGNIESLSGTGSSSVRPSDLNTNSADTSLYDAAFTLALGRYASTGATFNYGANGDLLPQGTGSIAKYRFYETELYVGDTWKLTPDLTISYGLRWQNYTVPYDTQGIESVPTLNFEQFFGARVAQSKAGEFGNTAVPFESYVLGGKNNHGPGYFAPVNHNFAPRIAFAYSPSFDKRTVLNGGAGIIFDHTVVNGILYQLAQFSYLFQANANTPFGETGNPYQSLMTDPRFTGTSTPVAPPNAPAALTPPYTPWVYQGTPYGLIDGGAFNEITDNTLKTPYSIGFNAGFQHQFQQGYILKINYVGRLGRRLLAQADANQLIDFPDSIGNSGQMMSQAFANMETQVRAGVTITPQPWFENMIPAGLGQEYGYTSNTDLVAVALEPLPYRGDFADTVQALAAYGLIPPNVGMGSQFSEDTYYTNEGFSNYNGMLVTLHKNAGYGLQFDINYTWSHSIDNVSIPAVNVAFGGYGFICDILRQRECRGDSDFDVASYLNGNFLYTLPFGRGQQFGATMPIWLNEIVGGWELSGLPSWHTGNTYFAAANAFVAGYANDAPAILTQPKGIVATHVHGGEGNPVNIYANPTAALAAFHGPVGFAIGSRNNLRGPGWFDIDLGAGKVFPLDGEKVVLKFRCDAFNSTNHPSFNLPSTDITESTGVPFGNISSTASSARVLQGALRLEF